MNHMRDMIVYEFVQAAEKNDIDTVRRMLETTPQLANEPDRYGGTALMRASERGHMSIVELLLKNGADVNAKKSTETALINASGKGHLPIVQLLVDNGADVNATSKDGMTALMKASASSHISIVQFLLDNGADVNAKDERGDTALMFAAGDNCDIIELLLDRGADINARDERGYTALMSASIDRFAPGVELLLHKGADVGAITDDGETALLIGMNYADVRTLLQEALKKHPARSAAPMNSARDVHKNYFVAEPENFLCPITKNIMVDPVICSDGHSYERGVIERWLQHHDTSPKTNMRLPNKNLIPNVALRGAIQEFSSRKRARK